MKKTVGWILCTIMQLHGMSVLSQETSVETQLSKTVIRCEDIYLNALEVIPVLYQTQPIDSVIRAITFWEEKCNVSEASQRIKILVAIKNRSFSELLYDNNISLHITEYLRVRGVSSIDSSGWFGSDVKYFKLLSHFNAFTKQLATQLLPLADTTTLEYFFASLYSDQPAVFKLLDNPRFTNTLLVQQEQKFKAESKKIPKGHFAVMTGIWLPTGKASLLGNHSYAGMQVGSKRAKNRFDLSLILRFGKSANTYQISRNGQLLDTRHYMGGYFGIDYGRELLSGRKYYLELVAGGGLDRCYVYHPKDKEDEQQKKPISIASYNLNTGFQYNVRINNILYVGFMAKYNIVHYNNKGGTSLSGQAIHTGIVLGLLSDDHDRFSYFRRP
jgi:hypothetical protein